MSVPCPIFGFTVRLAKRPGVIPTEFESLVADVRRVLETHGLETRGLSPRAADLSGALTLVVRREGAQATHADRELVVAWAAQRSSVAAVEVGDLVDLSDGG